MEKITAILFLLLITSLMECTRTDNITLQTKLGKILGVKETVQDQGTVYYFKKIPYAKPPMGDLRFRKPVPYNKWQHTLNATEYGPACLQENTNDTISEDCLHLNIFVPNAIDKTSLKSVMIWVHGGAYVVGSSLQYDGRNFALHGDIILVTINYRLGPWGFLTTEDSSSRGNYGLWDQHLAFQWVHDNIDDYGGNPNSVTIFGESAGGGSVSFQSLYPGNQGLFQKVIAQSGVATSVFLRADETNIYKKNAYFIQLLNCSFPSTLQAMDCLRSVSADSILKNSNSSPFSPVIDYDFVRGVPEIILENKTSKEFLFFTSLDYMVGFLNGDGSVVLPSLISQDILTKFNSSYQQGFTSDILCKYLAPIFATVGDKIPSMQSKNISDIICSMYGNETTIQQQSNLIVDYLSDLGFIFPAILSADYHYLRSTTNTTTYVYMFTRANPIQVQVFPRWTYPWMTRATHALDVVYQFNTDRLRRLPQDYALGKSILRYWTNFAKFSNPNGNNLPHWPQYDQRHQIQILDLAIETRSNILPERQSFWLDSIYDGKVKVNTTLGPILGSMKRISGAGNVFEFKKIPFAQPPVGNLRFRKPMPFSAWSSTLDATEFGPACMQLQSQVPMSEDCLHLNIYVPYHISNSSPKSVLIWVHGGGYSEGTGILYDSTALALLGDVIVVTINYRLGLFGFFTTGDSASPGNYGLWDQHMAFKWVHDNIEYFGGNPGSVTIFGESAGGGSVSFQGLYPGNRGLVHRVIPQSGVATSVALRADDSRITNASQAVFSMMNCSDTDINLAMDCLRKAPISVKQHSTYHIGGPSIDGDFIKGNAEDILKDKNSMESKFFRSLDYMVGVMSGDGAVTISTFVTPSELSAYNSSLDSGLTTAFLCDALAPKLSGLYNIQESKFSNDICKLYTDSSTVIAQGNKIVDLLTDAWFTAPSVLSAERHYFENNVKSTYMYYFSRINPLQYTALFKQWTKSWMNSATHGIDIWYLFFPNLHLADQPQDINLAKKMIAYWTNFAKTGNPNGPGVPSWPAYDQSQKVQTLNLQVKPQTNILSSRKTFWLETVFGRKSQSTSGPISVSSHTAGNPTFVVLLLVLILCGRY